MQSYNPNTHDIFRLAFEQKSNKPFAVFAERTITYGELRKKIGQYASYFHNEGIKKGDRIVFSSTYEPFVCLFSLSLIANGITVVFIDPDGGSKRSNAIIDHCRPHTVFLEEELKRKWHITHTASRNIVTIVPNTGNSVLYKLLRKKEDRNDSFPACVEALPESVLPREIDPESDAFIMFTSGTTSAPKGVRMSHRALFSHMQSLANVYELGSESKLFNNLMLSHTDGMTQGPVLALFTTATLYRPFLFSIQRIEDAFDIIYQRQITHWVIVPTMIALIYQFKQGDDDKLDRKGFKYVISCGGMLEAKLWQDFEDKFQVMIINGYGLTETIAGGLFAGPDEASHIIGTIGIPVDCEAIITDDNGKELPPGEHGELWLRGSLLMSGYLNAPEANQEVFSGDWLKTGDISYKGEDGCYRIVGRKKSVIISGGVNISPEEVTEVLNSHPAVLESVTFPIDDHIWGEKVACAICLKQDASAPEAEIIDYCRQHLEHRKIPSQVYFMDSLPRGRSGKIILPDIMEQIEGMDQDNHTDTHMNSGFLQIVAQSLQIQEDKISMNMLTEDTPEWDSIRHLVLIGDLEKHFNITFTPVEVMNVKKLSDLSGLVENKIR